ncbi:MAG: hypothetical protein FWE47_01430 [Oscillospiraceae bacterium]|nr:hypothetical protein [Oscillospiraceae bacterium]
MKNTSGNSTTFNKNLASLFRSLYKKTTIFEQNLLRYARYRKTPMIIPKNSNRRRLPLLKEIMNCSETKLVSSQKKQSPKMIEYFLGLKIVR